MSTTTLPPADYARMPASSVPGETTSRRAWIISLLLLLNFFYFFCSTGRVRTIDEVSADYQVESLAKHGTVAIPQAIEAQMFYGVFDRFGHPESPYPPGQAVAMLPWYAAGQFAARHLPGVLPGARDVVSDFFLTGESAFFAALSAAMAFCIFLQLGIAPKTSLAAAGILALATPLAAYSAWLFSEPLAAALLLGAAAVLFGPARDVPIPFSRALIAGSLLGAAIWVRPTHIIAVPVFLAAIFARDRERGWSPAIALAIASGTAASMLLWRNTYLYGSAFEFGYPSAAEGGKALNSFHTPFVTGLLGFLLSPGKSVFLFSPPILVALFGLPRLWHRDRGLAVVAAGAPVAYLLFFATYTQWEGGYCFGPRYLVPALALLGLGVGPAIDSASSAVRRFAVIAFATGILVQAVGLATNFLEAAVAGAYYDSQYNYRMSYSPLAAQFHLLLHYTAMATPSPIGLGFDRWWIFLHKAGVSTGAVLFLGALLLTGAAISALWLGRSISKAPEAA